MTEIYLIRHAQAEGNRYHMMQGHWDGGVTALGRRQIDRICAGGGLTGPAPRDDEIITREIEGAQAPPGDVFLFFFG